jgi:hypothetical protein
MPVEAANCAEFFKAALTAVAEPRRKPRFMAPMRRDLTAAAGFPIVPAMNGHSHVFGICREIIR